MNKQEILKAFGKFCDGNEFEINPDAAHVEACIDGLLENEKRHGLKYCPCRILSGEFEKDVLLICPCNFRAQEKYRTKGECWCGLFSKRGRKMNKGG